MAAAATPPTPLIHSPFRRAVDQSWLEGSKGIANITVANNSFTAIGAPPFASSMAQVLDSDPDVVNLVVSGNTVVQ